MNQVKQTQPKKEAKRCTWGEQETKHNILINEGRGSACEENWIVQILFSRVWSFKLGRRNSKRKIRVSLSQDFRMIVGQILFPYCVMGAEFWGEYIFLG